MDKSKEKRIKQELTRISKFFEKADGNQRALVAPLLQNAAFMAITLEDLQETINAEGATDEYQNGANQRGIKQSATLQSYNALIKNYTTVIKALSAVLPPEEKPVMGYPKILQQRMEQEKTTENEFERANRQAAELKSASEWQKADREGRTTLTFQQWQHEHGFTD